MYDFHFAKSHLKHVRRGFKLGMECLPVAKQTIWLRGRFQDVSKACLGWHDHLGCYAKKKNSKKLKLR